MYYVMQFAFVVIQNASQWHKKKRTLIISTKLIIKRQASSRFGSIAQQCCYQVPQQVSFFYIAIMSVMSFLTVTRWLLQLQASYPDRTVFKGRIVSLMHLFITEEILSRGQQRTASYSSLACLQDMVIPKPVTDKEIGITMIGLAREELLEG